MGGFLQALDGRESFSILYILLYSSYSLHKCLALANFVADFDIFSNSLNSKRFVFPSSDQRTNHSLKM